MPEMEMQHTEGQAPSLGTESMTVTMREELLFDFFLYHAYSKFSGFLSNLLGFAIFILGAYSYWAGQVDAMGCAFFVVGSIVFIASTPIQLRLKAKRAMKEATYSRPIDYTFIDGEGIRAEKEDGAAFYPWERVLRAAVAPKTIILYLEGDKALVLPKESFGDKFGKIYQMIAVNLGRSYRARMRARQEQGEAMRLEAQKGVE